MQLPEEGSRKAVTLQTHLRWSRCRRAKQCDGIGAAPLLKRPCPAIGCGEVGVERRVAAVQRRPDDLGGVPAEGRAREAIPGGVNDRKPVGGGSAVALGSAPVGALDPDLVERQVVAVHAVTEHVIVEDGGDHWPVPDGDANAARLHDDESPRRALHDDRVVVVGDLGQTQALVVDVALVEVIEVLVAALRDGAAHAAAAQGAEVDGVRARADGEAIPGRHVVVQALLALDGVPVGAVLDAAVAEVAGLRRAVAVRAALLEGTAAAGLEGVGVRALLPPQVGVGLDAPRARAARLDGAEINVGDPDYFHVTAVPDFNLPGDVVVPVQEHLDLNSLNRSRGGFQSGEKKSRNKREKAGEAPRRAFSGNSPPAPRRQASTAPSPSFLMSSSFFEMLFGLKSSSVNSGIPWARPPSLLKLMIREDAVDGSRRGRCPRNPAWTFAVGNTLERPADHTTATPEVGIAPVAENCRTFFVERVATSFPSLSRSRTRGSPVGRPMKKKTLAKLVYRRPIVVRRRSTPTKQRECHDASWGQVQCRLRTRRPGRTGKGYAGGSNMTDGPPEPGKGQGRSRGSQDQSWSRAFRFFCPSTRSFLHFVLSRGQPLRCVFVRKPRAAAADVQAGVVAFFVPGWIPIESTPWISRDFQSNPEIPDLHDSDFRISLSGCGYV
ncbi:hypothetical protein THAOC_10235 [Thalassiosira oceanica]|uniref:Uncharacterized protein n=1 Tax=Thalassiosira oceanica TaxID=159749 RepID=K0SQJ9_THAOC|nr:hypothetical protein THAOC_10235 [Thalassiosira oceanica]|eukprot:EJK68573.1 hypothetical protein THAOC_10235 [Thalassiosira oceanica]